LRRGRPTSARSTRLARIWFVFSLRREHPHPQSPPHPIHRPRHPPIRLPHRHPPRRPGGQTRTFHPLRQIRQTQRPLHHHRHHPHRRPRRHHLLPRPLPRRPPNRRL